MKYYSIHGSGDRWFWCAWLNTSSEQYPTFGDYATSSGEALSEIAQKLNLGAIDEAEKLKSSFAKLYRGTLPKNCKRCGAFDNWRIGAGSGQHTHRLICKSCNAGDKWLDSAQAELIERRMNCVSIN